MRATAMVWPHKENGWDKDEYQIKIKKKIPVGWPRTGWFGCVLEDVNKRGSSWQEIEEIDFGKIEDVGDCSFIHLCRTQTML